MKYSVFKRDIQRIDSTIYLSALRGFIHQLPTGARSFMEDTNHFDYTAFRTIETVIPDGTPLCPKDLKLVSLGLQNYPEGLVLETEYVFPGYPPGQVDLSLCYDRVTSIVIRDLNEIESDSQILGPTRLGRWMIDEAILVPGGVRHEVAFEDGILVVDCSDFKAVWR
jgi:hypothetical protein